MERYVLRRPPRVKIFKIESHVLHFIQRNINLTKDYYSIIYQDDKVYFGLLRNGEHINAAGRIINERLLNEIRIFNASCELRIVRNDDTYYMGRYIFDSTNVTITDRISKFAQSNYLYDEFYPFEGETALRTFNTTNTSRQRIHKGIVGGYITVPVSNMKYLGVKNYIEAVCENGLKFTDSRLTGLYDRDMVPIDMLEMEKGLALMRE